MHCAGAPPTVSALATGLPRGTRGTEETNPFQEQEQPEHGARHTRRPSISKRRWSALFSCPRRRAGQPRLMSQIGRQWPAGGRQALSKQEQSQAVIPGGTDGRGIGLALPMACRIGPWAPAGLVRRPPRHRHSRCSGGHAGRALPGAPRSGARRPPRCSSRAAWTLRRRAGRRLGRKFQPRSSRRRTFPVPVAGSASSNSSWRGTL